MCAIAGAYSLRGDDVGPLLNSMLERMYNRGHTAYGLAVYDGSRLHLRKGEGFPSDFPSGHIGIAHLRYATRGKNDNIAYNAQPKVLKFVQHKNKYIPEPCDHNEKLDIDIEGFFAVEHNGDIFDTGERRDALYECDVKYLAYPLGDEFGKHYKELDILNSIYKATKDLKGAFTYVGYVVDEQKKAKMFCGRDPWGVRPGFITWLDSEYFQGWLVASEDIALKALGCTDTFEMQHGCAYLLDQGCRSRAVKQYKNIKKPYVCAFEYVYFADIGTTIDSLSVASAKYLLGRQLGKEHPPDSKEQRIIPVPDSGRSMARGYADENGMQYFEGFSKNRRTSQRSFILQTQQQREFVALRKLVPIREIMEGQSVILIDDSLVRGTTMRAIIKNVRTVGQADEVHVRIASPPLVAPCYLGIDMKSVDEFIAARKARQLGCDPYNLEPDVVEEICKEIGADSLGYLSLDGMQKVLGKKCYGCWNPNLNPPYLKGQIKKFIKEHPEGLRV